MVVASQMPEDIEELLSTPTDQQIELEKWCYRIGGDRAVSGAWEKGAQGFLTQQFAELYLKASLKLWRQAMQGPTRNGAIWCLLRDEKAVAQVALETLHFLLSNVHDGVPRNRLAAQLGTRAEYVLFMTLPIWKGSRHIEALRRINGRNLSMKTLRQRLMAQGFRQLMGYKPLRSVEKLALGTLFLEIANQVTGLFTFELQKGLKKQVWICRFTEGYWTFLNHWRTNLLTHRPTYLPMMVPPRDWHGLTEGGYLSTPTAVSSIPWERWRHLTKHIHPCVLGSINILQKVPFRPNKDQIELQRECWERNISVGALPKRDRMEEPSKRQYILQELPLRDFWAEYWKWKADQKLNPIRTKFIHSLMGWQKVQHHPRHFFVWHMDYRGRLYQRGSGINYMGSDPFRTQLQFEQSAPMEPHMEEFCCALADAADVGGNTLQRVNWCAQHHEQIRKVGANPLNYRAFWEGKKSPWRFVELCLEYECWCDDRSYQTHSIFQLDQSTSAYGHVACLLRSDYLAGLTNVIGHQRRDIYEEVGIRTYELMKWKLIEPPLKHEAYSKAWWLKEFEAKQRIPRELIKPLIMPLVYRISYQTMVENINSWLADRLKNFLNDDGIRTIDLAHTLARFVHQASKEILPGINALHQWLCAVAKIQMQQNFRPYWVTPNGLGVESYSTIKSVEEIYLEVSGRKIRVNTKADDTPEGSRIDTRKSTSQLSADFCHSHDAAFIQRFIWHWGHTYQKPIVTIHDCAGTTLDNIALMRRELPDQFSRYYSEDHLGLMHRQLEKELKVKIPHPPMEHSLEVNRIGENPYLFT